MEVPEKARLDNRVDELTTLQRYADNPNGFLALNKGNEYFTAPGVEGYICYRPYGRRWVQFGGPFADPDNRKALESLFLRRAHTRGRKVVGIQLQRADAELLADLGMTVNQIGASYAVELADFSLRGKHFVRLRNKISRALRAGLEVAEVDPASLTDVIRDIDAHWLRQKGAHAKELAFLIGEVGGPWQAHRRLFMGHIDGAPVGYISFSPAYGTRPGWLHDLSRRLPGCPPGVMEAINSRAVDDFRAAGARWLHFGFTPFTGLDSGPAMPTASRAVSKIVHLLAERGEAVYPARTQLEYKMKWRPSVVLPEYAAFDGGVSIRSLWSLLRLTRVI